MKYMGSKSRIAKYIVPILQQTIDETNSELYIEPFVGGANIIDKIKCKNKIGSDLNQYLIALFNYLKNDGKLLSEVSKELYDNARNEVKLGVPNMPDWKIANIGFLASYNGRWFDGGYAKSGYEKTAKGLRYRDYYQEAKKNIEKQVSTIKDVTFLNKDYEFFTDIATKRQNIVFYCDPPYENTKEYKNSLNFDYKKFWNNMREWSKNNIVFISELNAPEDFIPILTIKTSRSIKAADKGFAEEKLFVHHTYENRF